MMHEWKLFYAWLLLVIILLFVECTKVSVVTNIEPITYKLIEPLGTVHEYKKEPLIGKSYYCLTHEAPEVIWESDETKRVRRYSGPRWGNY